MARYIAIKFPPTDSMDVNAVMRGDEFTNGKLNLASRYVQAALAAFVGRDVVMEGIAPADLSDADLTSSLARLEAEAETEREDIAAELEYDREGARLEHEQNLRDLPTVQEVITTLKPLADRPHVKDALAALERAEVALLAPPATPTARRRDPALAMALGAVRAEAKRRGVARGEELDRLRTQLGALGVQV
jgi:hypothetical protein